MTRVKICGLRREEDALAAAEAGADILGFVFAPSRRRIDPDEARLIIGRIKERITAKIVGVFVDESPEDMNRIAHHCRLDYVQLSGDEPDDVLAELDVPAIQVIHVGETTPAETVRERVVASSAALVMLDTAVAGWQGGTGRQIEWHRLPPMERPVLLAGGLHAFNVTEALRTVNPWGVDVSSGVETDGQKDHGKIRAFMVAVQQAQQGDDAHVN
jgi:phosphoribosylanthranilate isomerase